MKFYIYTIAFLISFVACSTSTNKNGEQVTINAEAFSAKMSDENVILVDVRTPKEFAGGSIEGAHNIDYYSDDFATEINKLDKSKTILLFCRSGMRSSKAANLMINELGFEQVYDLEGGFIQWNKDGRTVVVGANLFVKE